MMIKHLSLALLLFSLLFACEDPAQNQAQSKLDQSIDQQVFEDMSRLDKALVLDLHLIDQGGSQQRIDQSMLDLASLDISFMDQHIPLNDMTQSEQIDANIDLSIMDQMLAMDMSIDSCAILGQGLSGAMLAQHLHESLVNAYRPIPVEPDLGGNPNRYTTARRLMFRDIYPNRSAGGVVEDECVYTNQRAPVLEATGEPNRELLNCEHVFPREWMEQDRTTILFAHQESDLNNLAPSNPLANSARGNLPYDVVNNIDNSDFLPSKIGSNHSGNTVFEPQDETKGDLARVVLYFSLRWAIPLDFYQSPSILLQWHAQDPVNEEEIRRNQLIKERQGASNPFIECPQFAQQIDFSMYAWTLSQASINALPNP